MCCAATPRRKSKPCMGFFLARQGQYDTFLLDLGAVTQNTAETM